MLLSIPIGAYLASEFRTTVKSSASEKKTTKLAQVTPKPATSSAKQLLNTASLSQKSLPPPSPSATASTTLPISYGPTLAFKIALEGRPKTNQATRLFVGIAEGPLTANPKFVLNFTVDVPASGQFAGLSLAGLNPGTQYTALLKGSAQIASSVAFTMSPAVSNLNNGQDINLTSGDLNDDNVINNTDYTILQRAYGAAPTAANWNENADFNKDGAVNLIDRAVLNKNLGQAGITGAWTSPLPQASTPSASLTAPSTGGPLNTGGYWMWLPK